MFSFLFRVDALPRIGGGHLMRCLALADHIYMHGGKVTFLSSCLSESYRKLLLSKGHSILDIDPTIEDETIVCPLVDSTHTAWLPWSEEQDVSLCSRLLSGTRFDWLVVDHYALTAKWEQAMSWAADYIMAIDDLANRDHFCDLLLDQNFGRYASHYSNRVCNRARILIGPKFALLRPEFAEYRPNSMARRSLSASHKLLISFGAVDHGNYTTAVLRSLSKVNLGSDTEIDVVLGPESPHILSVQEEIIQSGWGIRLHHNSPNIALLMADATLAIGAAGISTWERCCLGLPSLIVVIAGNQLPAARALSDAGHIVLADPSKPLEVSVPLGVEKLISLSKQISLRCAEVTDGRGVARVFHEIRDLATT
jgi:UDP-2,4-diacetamido-2,4,6-trideoxy-beta-L-altropyranose hydrolase